jgi:hypothetical protein
MFVLVLVFLNTDHFTRILHVKTLHYYHTLERKDGKVLNMEMIFP